MQYLYFENLRSETFPRGTSAEKLGFKTWLGFLELAAEWSAGSKWTVMIVNLFGLLHPLWKECCPVECKSFLRYNQELFHLFYDK